MKSSQLFLGTVIVFLMTVFSANAAKHSSFQSTKKKVETGNETFAYGVCPAGWAADASDSSNIPVVKATTSCSNLPSPFYVGSSQETICLFEIRFKDLIFEDYRPSTPVALNRFYLHLFTVIISPNAP